MNSQKIAVESLAMDLKRVALGLNRGSFKMAERFKEEALERQKEIETIGIQSIYLNKLVTKTKSILASNSDRVAEDAQMYSTLFQNFAQKCM